MSCRKTYVSTADYIWNYNADWFRCRNVSWRFYLSGACLFGSGAGTYDAVLCYVYIHGN